MKLAKLIKRLFLLGMLAAISIVAILVFQLLYFQHNTVAVPSQPTVFLIKSGSNINSIAQDLSMQEIIEDPWLFILLAKIKGVETRVRAGEYEVEPGMTPASELTLQYPDIATMAEVGSDSRLMPLETRL